MMLPYNKMRLWKGLWLFVACVGMATVAALPVPLNMLGCLVLAVGVGEWVAVDEEWKYRDVREYLRREGFLK